MIEIRMPGVFKSALKFVESVTRHGYADAGAIRNVVNDCAQVSFEATGESFDPETDTELFVPTECMQDKLPGFLPGVPVKLKLEAYRQAAKRGTGTRTEFFVTKYSGGYVEVRLGGLLSGERPLILAFAVPSTPQRDPTPLQRPRPGIPAANWPVGHPANVGRPLPNSTGQFHTQAMPPFGAPGSIGATSSPFPGPPMQQAQLGARLPLRSIHLGPAISTELNRQSVRLALEKLGLHDIAIHKSEIPYVPT
jgi:hypothetical protein